MFKYIFKDFRTKKYFPTAVNTSYMTDYRGGKNFEQFFFPLGQNLFYNCIIYIAKKHLVRKNF